MAVRGMLVASVLAFGLGQSSGEETLALELPTASPEQTNVTFVYVVGVEGSGHHGVTYELVVPLLESQAPDSETRRWLECPGIELTNTYNESAVSDCLTPPPGKHLYVWEDCSFPCGHLEDARLRQPTFDFSALYDAVAPHVDVFRYVLLRRDLPSTIMSHFYFDATPEIHADLMARHERHIASSMLHVPRETWAVFPVDCLYHSDEARLGLIRPLAHFLRVSRHCETCFNTWRRQWDHSKKEDDELERTIRTVITENMEYFGPFTPFPECNTNPECRNATFLADPRTCAIHKAPAERIRQLGVKPSRNW